MLNSLVALYDSGVPASTNSYESIATVTVGSGGSSSVTFSSIPSTYSHLQIRAFAATSRATYGDDFIAARFNSDTGNNYSIHSISGDGASASASGTASYGYLTTWYGSAGGSGATNVFGASVWDLLDYSNINKYKTVRILNGVDINGTIAGYGGKVGLSSGSWMNTSAISSIVLTGGNGNFVQYSQFALYGIKA